MFVESTDVSDKKTIQEYEQSDSDRPLSPLCQVTSESAAALKKSQEYLETALENSVNILILLDSEGCLTLASQMFLRVAGVKD